MWEINNGLQLLTFARSLGLGVIICLCYDVLRALRKVCSFSTVGIFLQDIIFSLLTGFIVFLFLLSVTNGEMRGYVLMGLGMGFVAGRLSISIVWFGILKWISGRMKYVFRWVSGHIYSGFDKSTVNIGIFLKKTGKTIKKVLKTQAVLLYTKGNRKNRSRAYEGKTEKE